MPPQLPYDILRLVFAIFEAERDLNSLCACMTSSNGFKDAATPYLYKTVTIRVSFWIPSNLEPLIENDKKSNLESAIYALCRPEIQTFVTDLIIEGRASREYVADSVLIDLRVIGGVRLLSRIPEEEFMNSLPCLKNLRRISMTIEDPSHHSETSMFDLMESLPLSAAVLEMETGWSWRRSDEKDAMTVAALCKVARPGLRKLAIIGFALAQPDWSTCLETAKSLVEVQLRSHVSIESLQWFL